MSKQSPERILLTYISNSFVSKEDLLPCAAYLENGVIKDFMFSSFVFLPNPDYLYDWKPANGGKKALRKQDWQDYITNIQFRKDVNMEALETVVGQAKAELNQPDYRATVYFSLFYPVRAVSDFGEVGDKNLDFSDENDRLTAEKWMIDEYIRLFQDRKYQHLCLAGFYWFTEEIERQDYDLIRGLTDYVRSVGLKTIWAGYFGAQGTAIANTLGIDEPYMQANYFPGTPEAPNCGGLCRLKQTADFVKEHHMGVELEFSGEHDCDTAYEAFKAYFAEGIRSGYMNRSCAFYINGGPPTVRYFSEADNGYRNSVYKELFLFNKGILTEKAMIQKEGVDA